MKRIPFKILNNTIVFLDWKESLRMLFGKPMHVSITILVDKEVDIVGETKTTAYVDPLISKSKRE